MRRRLASCALLLCGMAAAPAETPSAEGKTLAMTEAVVCRSVQGYEDYEPLPGAALTSDEKLIIYYRPLGFQNAREGRTYRAHLSQDGRLRRRDDKAVLQSKDRMLGYEPKGDRPIEHIYIKCAVSLKGLKPGDYSFDVILHDEIGKGPPAKQTVKFTVVPARTAKGEEAKSP